jgi:TolB protein
VNTGALFEWESADPTIATVGEADGRVTAVSAGTTTVTAYLGSLRASASVSVIAMPAGAIAFTRTTYSGGAASLDLLLFSVPDLTLRTLPRPAQFPVIAAPAWSSDGTLLALEVVAPNSIVTSEDGLAYASDLYVLPAAATATSPWRALTTNGHSRSPSWSPDGTRIAYLASSPLPFGYDIYVIAAVGGEPLRLTQGDGYYGKPSWSPDGRRLAFSAWIAGNNEIYIVNADGSGLTNVTRSSAYDGDPSWSPDGSRLVFVSDRLLGEEGIGVFVIDVDGSNLRSLSSVEGRWSAGPAWSADGRQIVFSGAEHFTSSIFVMNADGSSLARLTTAPSSSWDGGLAWRR